PAAHVSHDSRAPPTHRARPRQPILAASAPIRILLVRIRSPTRGPPTQAEQRARSVFPPPARPPRQAGRRFHPLPEGHEQAAGGRQSTPLPARTGQAAPADGPARPARLGGHRLGAAGRLARFAGAPSQARPVPPPVPPPP